jgi:23S rRNA (cytidine1920-2'-O)/16S rRNA (cytidine1409-2'-O)-methyltransferase
MNKIRIDQYLVENHLLPDLKTAQAWIISGNVLLDNQVQTKVGYPVKPKNYVSLKKDYGKYVSRGGLKLEKALNSFKINVENSICLDAGACTGGFTDCLLQYHAKKVYAVDVGFGQIRGKIANDPRVQNWEKTNIGNLKLEDFNPIPSICVMDLSYLSLSKALPQISSTFKNQILFLSLIKPLFEGLDRLDMINEKSLQVCLNQLISNLNDKDFICLDLCESPILGNTGSKEYLGLFLHNENERFKELKKSYQNIEAIQDVLK